MHKLFIVFLVCMVGLTASSIESDALPVFAASPYSILLEDFRWNTPQIRVLVDMNQWSTPDYAVAVHEAVNTWLSSISEYEDKYFDKALEDIDFALYISNVNATGEYDIYVSFAAYEIPPGSNIIGLTTSKWDEGSHEPESPIIINITTYSAIASPTFVRNVAMHELGHALGLGHTTSMYTANGPELMWNWSSTHQPVYPSTLDVHGLVQLYRGLFRKSIQLPQYIPYELLAGDNAPPSYMTQFWESFVKLLAILIAIFGVLVLGLIFMRRAEKKKLEQTVSEGSSSLNRHTRFGPPTILLLFGFFLDPSMSSSVHVSHSDYCPLGSRIQVSSMMPKRHATCKPAGSPRSKLLRLTE